MLNFLFLAASSPQRQVFLLVRHLGALGLFFLAILDSSPIPTFCGPDVLIVVLVAARRNPWYEYPIVAACGSLIGACLTYRLARNAGEAYLVKRLGESAVARFLQVFKHSGTTALIASSGVPFPFPTSMVFAAAGASGYPLTRYIIIVLLSRSARYTVLALLADRYGRHLARVFLHPGQYWPWFLALLASVLLAAAAGHFIKRLTFGTADNEFFGRFRSIAFRRPGS
jgi:membrane protein YqaA with SNARE-associated domain